MPAPFTALQHCQTTTEQRVLSTNVAVPQPDPAGADGPDPFLVDT